MRTWAGAQARSGLAEAKERDQETYVLAKSGGEGNSMNGTPVTCKGGYKAVRESHYILRVFNSCAK